MIKRSNLSTALLDKVVNIPVIQITLLVILFILFFQSYLTCFLKALKNIRAFIVLALMCFNYIICSLKVLKNTTMLFTCIAVFHMFSLSAQTPRKDSGANGLLTVSGTVISASDSQPIAGVSVSIADEKGRASTKSDGSFTIEVKAKKGKILFSHLGYHAQSLNYTAGVSIDVQLIPMDNRLDETVVIGYGTTTRRHSTGAVTKVSSSEIANQPIANPLEALRGKVPGLLITQNNGGSGAGFKVQLRGQSSFSQGSDPLFIVDGIPLSAGNNDLNQLGSSSGSTEAGKGMSPLNLINPSDIESIEVLKDADATAIYGSRGANGVILITTKKAKNTGQTLDFNIYKGLQRPNRSMKMMGTKDYLQMRREAFRQDNMEPTAQNAPDLMLWDTLRHTDFEKLLIGNTASVLDAQLSYGQRSELSNIMFRGSYRNEGNLMSKDLNAARYGLFTSGEIRSKDQKFTLSAISAFTVSNSNLNATDLSAYVNTIPTLKIYNDSGLNWEEDGVDYYSIGYPDLNPLKFKEEGYSATFQHLNSSLQMNYILPEEIILKVNGGYSLINGDEKALFPSRSINPYSGMLASSQFGHKKSSSWIVEPQLSKNFNWSDWKVALLLGGTLQDLYTESTRIYGMDYQSDILLESLAAAGYQYGNTDKSHYRYMGVYGRGTFNYRNRYIVNISGRRDGSSRFAPEARFSNFGAVGLAWLLSEEPFFKVDKSILSFSKLRASYGVTGNDQIGDYKYLEIWQPQSNGTYQGVPTIRPVSLLNRNYAWERNRKLEIGADMGFAKDRFFLSIGYYRNQSDNQLINYTLPNQTGFASILRNLDAVVLNRGLEATLDGQVVANKNFSWKTSVNFSLNRNKLVDFPGLSSSSYKNSYIIGKPLNIRQTYRYLGVNSETGLYEIADINGDQLLNQEDKIMVTDLDPKFMGGWYNTFNYGNFSLYLGVDFRKQKGINYLGSLGAVVPGYGLVNQPRIALDRWQKAGDIAPIQRYTAGDTNALTAAFNMRQSDAIYSDASFIRLRNVAIYYQFPQNILKCLRLTNLKLFMQAENVYTWTGYKGSDPETQNLMALPPLRTITMGLNINL